MPCSLCDGTGRQPFKNKQGLVVPNAVLYCSCHRDEPERNYPLSPEDIDFPVSASGYRSLCQQHGWADPGANEFTPDEETKPSVRTAPVTVNVTYQVGRANLMPALKEVNEKLAKMDGKLHRYFEEAREKKGKY